MLDYDDLIVKTRNLLEARRRRAWVLYKLDGGIDHILIDEAQDTSPEQWEIVRKLTEEFFAGAGARARPAPHHLRGGRREAIHLQLPGRRSRASSTSTAAISRTSCAGAEQPCVEQPLITSRRSAPEILQFVDTVFAEPSGARRPDRRAAARSRIGPIAQTAKGGIEFWPALVPPPDEDEIDPLSRRWMRCRRTARSSGWPRGWRTRSPDWLNTGAAPARP